MLFRGDGDEDGNEGMRETSGMDVGSGRVYCGDGVDGASSGPAGYRGGLTEDRTDSRSAVHRKALQAADAEERLQHLLAAQCTGADESNASVSRH